MEPGVSETDLQDADEPGHSRVDSDGQGSRSVGDGPASSESRASEAPRSAGSLGVRASRFAVSGLITLNAVAFVFPYAFGWIPWAEVLWGASGSFVALQQLGGLTTWDPFTSNPLQFLTHSSLHGGALHLVSNMIALVSLGGVLSGLVGPRRFLSIYFLCAIGGGVLSKFMNETALAVGASGAVFGCGWALGVAVLRHRRRLPAGWALRLALPLLGFLTVLLLTVPLLEDFLPGNTKVDNYGHLGGSIVGALLGLLPVSLLFARRSAAARAEWLFVVVALSVAFAPPIYAMIEGPLEGEELYDSLQTVALDPIPLELRLPGGWTREEQGGRVQWAAPHDGGYLIIETYGSVRRAPSLLTREDWLEREYDRLRERGDIASYTRVYRSDFVGNRGPGGILVAYRLEGARGSRLYVARLLDVPGVSADLLFVLPDTDRNLAFGLMVLERVKSTR